MGQVLWVQAKSIKIKKTSLGSIWGLELPTYLLHAALYYKLLKERTLIFIIIFRQKLWNVVFQFLWPMPAGPGADKI